jgi:hypothetical protein
MGVILSKPTAARLIALLDRQGPNPAHTLPASRAGMRPESESAYAAPFTVRYSVACSSWLIYLPPNCAMFAGTSENVAVTLAAAEELEGWYKFSGSTSGTVFVWAEKAAGAPDDWWGSWENASLNAGQTLPDGAAASGAFIPVASIDTATYRVRQFVSSCLRLISAPPDNASVEIAYDANGYPITQLYGFNGDDSTGLGLAQCLEVDEATGAIKAKDESAQYRLVVQVVSDDGNVLGYMPLGEGDGSDPSAGAPSECGHDGAPGGGAGGGGGSDENTTGSGENEDERGAPGGDGIDTRVDRDNEAFPSKTGPCW